MNFEQEEARVRLIRLIAEEAMAMHAEAVAAGDVEESSDPSESFLRGVVHGIVVMMMTHEAYEIKAAEVVVRAANN